MSSEFYQEIGVNIHTTEDDPLLVEDSIKSVNVRIEAARSGRINGNQVFYTPKAMDQGMESLLKPFNKHLQSKHYGEAVGPITDAEHVLELFPTASNKFLEIVSRVRKYSEESNRIELVKAVKELIQTKEYKSSSYRGLGIANVYGEVHDPNTIYNLRTNGDRKGKVSIGGKSKEVYCSICSEKVVGKHHRHKKGNYYNEEMCFHINNDLYLDHCGFVSVPADVFTNTEVVQDDQNDDLEVSVIDIRVQDSAENLMNLETLKQQAKDIDSVKNLISEYFTDADKAKTASDLYEKSLKGSRANHYLLSDGNVLNLRTPVGIYIAEQLASKFDDNDADKAYILEVIEKAKTTLKIDNTDKALEELLDKTDDKGSTNESDTSKEEKQNDKTDRSSKNTTDTSDKQTEVQDGQDLNLKLDVILEAVRDIVKTELASFSKDFSEVKDSLDNSVLHQELAKLRVALDTEEAATNTLREDYQSSLVEQIILLKGGKVSEEYQAKLKNRTVEELKITLDDVKEQQQVLSDNRETKQDLQTTTTEAAVQTVQDNLGGEDGAKEEDNNSGTEGSDETTETTETQTKDEETKVEDEVNDPSAWFAKRTKEVGLIKATKEYKKKFKTL